MDNITSGKKYPYNTVFLLSGIQLFTLFLLIMYIQSKIHRQNVTLSDLHAMITVLVIIICMTVFLVGLGYKVLRDSQILTKMANQQLQSEAISVANQNAALREDNERLRDLLKRSASTPNSGFSAPR